VHSGYEASAVNHTFSSLTGLLATAKATFFQRYEDPDANLPEPILPVHAFNPLVQIGKTAEAELEKTEA
jgi:hypothetical protein